MSYQIIQTLPWDELAHRFRMAPPIRVYQVASDCWMFWGAEAPNVQLWFSPYPVGADVLDGAMHLGPYNPVFHLAIPPNCTTEAAFYAALVARYPDSVLLDLPKLPRVLEELCQ